MIQVKEIKKVFRTEEVETWAISNISLNVNVGEFVAIMGPSGCGKSTLLNILGLIDTPSGGTYLLDGKDVSSLKENDRIDLRKGVIGFVFQSFNLIDELTVEENIELPLLYMGIGKRERKERVQKAMERMNIAHRSRHFPAQLSGGQQQRVAIARAVISNPKLILADEPTGNLDSKNGEEVMQLLSELHKEGTTIVMVTHSQHDAGYANRIVKLFDGHVVSELEM
ncbi:ABC transporter ATP-binding protein [Lepagella muris]|jgi:putative ABC transport system ATP-binding protein|uniref:ABC transporter ATP-binding protein n=1 Tax=Lepagella muris TaxID=3032870 RepID=A0AC61RHU7_9BACT|nr:ABC transporter ATP-binding protein [Lepagella muris]ROT06075.1 ABC transporter ATP-binding protein [Muribaculaceae bacterium Isolate-037 (Harlan)]TGY80493.1 ABC transporter ATP-binding protein [Lepagella muris]THG53391.1 ABC transporter ATP-binding protein [Bacteroidales bacterium]TKC61614.1 ABC transporter ATP-binding protein [Bacteroidales bacterium]